MKGLRSIGLLAGIVSLVVACDGGDTTTSNGPTTLADDSGSGEGSGGDTGADTGGASEESGSAEALSFEADVYPIMEANCVEGCHEAGGMWSTLPFDSADVAYENLTTMQSIVAQTPFVVANDLDGSYVYRKLTGENISGIQMPYEPGPPAVPTPLPEAEIEVFAQWIETGAMP